MGLFAKLSIKSRLTLMLIVVSLLSILIIGFLGWQNGQRALNQAIFNQLTSIRASKASQIELYFDRIFSQARTLAEDRMVVNAMQQFKVGYQEGSERLLSAEQYQLVTDYYDQEFLPRLAENVDETPLTVLYHPKRQVANYFQYYYMANNPFPVGQKDELTVSEEDTTTYNRTHQTYHPIFRNLLDEFGYYDLFLIDIKTGNIVYSVFKEVDYATSLVEGPYRESGLGILAARIREAPTRDSVTIVDFRPYDPSYAAPAAFVGVPIFDRNQAIGILALQLPVKEINNVMTGGQQWREHGLGESGESYLVGSDRLMRSVSRFYLEDKEAYFDSLRSIGLSETTIKQINNSDTTILLQPVNTEGVQQALAGETSTRIINDYRGIPVLSSYAQIQVLGLDWVILSEIDVAEVLTPIYTLQRNLLISSVVLILAVAFTAISLSRYFVRPIEKLITGVKELSSGRDDVYIDIRSDDEFGELGQHFNTMVTSIRKQKTIIEEKNAENQRLLLNILPAPIAERLKTGERIADQLQQVSVVFIHMLGFAELSERSEAAVSAEVLEKLVELLDEAASKHDVQRVKTIGETYIAACGLLTGRLDHAKRSVDFAVDALKIMQQFDNKQGESLALQIGINSGPVISGVVGSQFFNYNLWGETVNIANRIHTAAHPNAILLTETVYQRIGAQFDFTPHTSIMYNAEEIQVYQLRLDSEVEHVNGEVRGDV